MKNRGSTDSAETSRKLARVWGAMHVAAYVACAIALPPLFPSTLAGWVLCIGFWACMWKATYYISKALVLALYRAMP